MYIKNVSYNVIIGNDFYFWLRILPIDSSWSKKIERKNVYIRVGIDKLLRTTRINTGIFFYLLLCTRYIHRVNSILYSDGINKVLAATDSDIPFVHVNSALKILRYQYSQIQYK